jgi:hypothetical protein
MTKPTPKERVLAKFPKAYIHSVVWPFPVYWVMASGRHKDSFSVGQPSARAAWADAARRLKGQKHG